MDTRSQNLPRVGLPYRTIEEERAGKRDRYEHYCRMIREAGGEVVEVSLLQAPTELKRQAESLDAVVLPGSPADMNPALYHAAPNPKTAEADASRERADTTLLEQAFAAGKPVLAICYGVQSLNVFLGGSLVQDIPTEIITRIRHSRDGMEKTDPDPQHPIQLEAGSQLARLAGSTEARVNSSHHQAIREPGRGLKITARAPDGIVEAVELAGGGNQLIGVQWHPERMHGDALATALFRELMEAARAAAMSH
ncbi:MAG: gamma-glutamyl-gamma-aminobutyrate hydrolase family protein [Candidatus Acidiferrales bacterium]